LYVQTIKQQIITEAQKQDKATNIKNKGQMNNRKLRQPITNIKYPHLKEITKGYCTVTDHLYHRNP